MWRYTHQNVLLLPLLQALLLPLSSVEGRFYIGRYKTVPAQVSEEANARSMPYIVYADEEGNVIGNYDTGNNNNRRIERPPVPESYHQHNTNQRWDIDPPTLYGPASFYANDQKNGYSVVSHKDIDYVVPPFTPGGRVNVAFQFWIPISIGGFFVTGSDLQKALRSDNPTAYISSLFLKHLSTNSTASDLLGELSSPMLEQSIQTFLDWVKPYLEYFAGSDLNEVDPSLLNDQSELKSRKKRDAEGGIGGWVTIGGGGTHNSDHEVPTEGMTNQGSDASSSSNVQSNRVIWTDEQILSDNSLGAQDSKRRPGTIDFGTSINTPYVRPRPFTSRPTLISSNRPTLSYAPSPLPSYPTSSDIRPPFHLTSFDDLPSGTANGNKGLDVSMRLSRLDYFFTNLHLDHEECRRRVLCEVAREPETFSPLSDVINGETRIPGNFRDLSRELLNTAEGARLLSYIEAVKLGEDKSKECDVYRYRCRTKAREIINTDILPIWREVVRWLTVKVLTQDTNGF